MADYNIEMKKRNVTNTAWDNLYPITKGGNVVAQDGVTTFDSHLSDTIYQTAGGTATAITLIISATLVNGYPVTFIASASNSGAATTINTKPLYKPNTTTAPTLIAGKAYTVWYKLASNCFFIKASAEGTATTAQVLATVPFSNETDNGLIGIMPNVGSVGTQNLVSQNQEYAIAAGYHNGLGKVKAVITGLIASVIKAGTTVGGIVGTFTSDATATASQMLSGVKAYVNGSLVTGTMPARGSEEYPGWRRAIMGTQIATDGRIHLGIPNGAYLDVNSPQGGMGIFADEPNFLAANLLGGKTYFGMVGGIENNSLAYHEATNVSPYDGVLYFMPPVGYFDGGGQSWIFRNDPNYKASNIPLGKSMFGLAGTLIVDPDLVAGTTLLANADTLKYTTSTTPVKMKEIQMTKKGTIRVSYDYADVDDSVDGIGGSLRKNDVEIKYTATAYTTFTTMTYDTSVNVGDKIQVYLFTSNAAKRAAIQNFRIFVYVAPPTGATVILN